MTREFAAQPSTDRRSAPGLRSGKTRPCRPVGLSKVTAVGGTAAVVLALIGLLAASNAGAQIAAVRAAARPAIDGHLEPLWETGRAFEQFVQVDPDIVREPSVRTEVYLLYDSDYVYLAARMYQPRATIRATQGRRDADVVLEGDTIAFLLDPLVNGNFAYVFAVNPANGIADGRLVDGSALDTSWDGSFTSATRIEDDSWSVEIEIPVTSISYQNREEQDWGVLVERIFAQEQRTFLNHLGSENRPYQIARFPRVSGLRGLGGGNSWSVVPYVFGTRAEPRTGGGSHSESKAGVDLRLRPVSSMTLLLTANPDYAQIESDREIINISDVPESYEEKRPFFTESSDLYPGLAVNTRNIQDIRFGLKLRQVLRRVKYDATLVEDGDGARWMLGDFRWTDNEKFYVDLIGGLKDAEGSHDYNVTANLRRWWFDRRLVAYTWFGTINSPDGGANEWESVNSVQWNTRKVSTGVWNHFKSELYNPNIVGHNTLSNEVIIKGWVEYKRYSETSRLRRLTPRIEVSQKDLYAGAGGSYLEVDVSLISLLRLSEALGDTEVTLRCGLPIEQQFRHRGVQDYDPSLVFRDAFGDFALERQKRTRYEVSLRSDFSKPFGMALTWGEGVVRGSPSRTMALETYWKAGSRTMLSYTFDSLELSGSPFQNRYREDVQRLKVEHNPTDRFNIRGIFDLNASRQTSTDVTEVSTPTANLTLSWEYRTGSFLYFVFNEWRRNAESSLPGSDGDRKGERSVALKVSRDLTFRR